MTELISSRSNPLVKQIRILQQRKARKESGLFLVEGIHHVGEAYAAGWSFETLIYAPDQLSSKFAIQLVDKCVHKGIRCVAMPTALFASISGKENPQGLLAIVHQRDLTLSDITTSNFKFCVALITPQDPGNVGTILRSMDATGAEALFLLNGGVDQYHSSCVRASMGTLFWKPVINAGFGDFNKWRRSNKLELIGTSAHAALDYRNYQRGNQQIILLFGSEQKGLTKDQIGACDVTLSLPMLGRVSSLNLAVAAGILLYELQKPVSSMRT
jgi:TrmH family RNA methyltransferase